MNIYSLKTIAPTLLSYRIIVVALSHFALSTFLHVRFLHKNRVICEFRNVNFPLVLL